jgi:hypothetical protein
MSGSLPLPDPWCDWPNGYPYQDMMPLAGATPSGGEPGASLSANATTQEIYEALLDLMEEDLVDDQVRAAYNHLEVTGRRLVVDAWLYDAETRAELMKRFEDVARKADKSPIALHEILPFLWNA